MDTTVSLVSGPKLATMLHASLNWIGIHREPLNRQNVYPVPDGDTGINMWLTLKSACQSIENSKHRGAAILWQLAAQGALEGSRGNSGVILSQFMKGMGEMWQHEQHLSVAAFKRALPAGYERAYNAVENPQEGTILTVTRDVAMGADSLQDDVLFEDFLASLVREAKLSVARTPDLLPVLKQAGVVDAGGWGLALFLEGLLKGYRGETLSDSLMAKTEDEVTSVPARFEVLPEQVHGFDVQFLIHQPKLAVRTLRAKVATMGDFPLVDGDSDLVKVHLHTLDPGPVLSWACRTGFITDVVVENMDAMAQVAGLRAEPSTESGSAEGKIRLLVPVQESETAVVAVSTTAGFSALFESLGVHCLVECDHTFNPSVGQFKEAIVQAGGARTILLPNNSNAIAAAKQARGELKEGTIAVLNTPAIPNGITAMYGFEPSRPWQQLLDDMQVQADRIVHGSLARSSRPLEVSNVRIEEGDWVALAHGREVISGSSVFHEVSSSLLQDFLLPAAKSQVQETFDLFTIFRGEEACSEQDRELGRIISAIASDFGVEWVDTGQPHHAYWLVME